MAAYFGGKRSGAASVSSNFDSGNGHSSLGTSPCSPSALSLNDEPIAASGQQVVSNGVDVTPTNEEIDIALRKSEVIEKELLAETEPGTSLPRSELVVEGKSRRNKNKSAEKVPKGSPEEGVSSKRRYDSGQSSASEL